MVKISVDLVFENEAMYEDFIDAAEIAGLSPDDYLLRLLERNLNHDNNDPADWLDVS